MALDNLTTLIEVLLNIIAYVSGGGYYASYYCCLSVTLLPYPTLCCIGTLNLAGGLLASVGQLE